MKSGPSCDWILTCLLTGFPQLDDDTILLSLETLTLDHFFLDEPLIKFIVNQSPNLKHLVLRICVAGCLDGGMSEVADPPTWAQFFTRLTTGTKNLQSLTIQHQYPERELLDSSAPEQDANIKSTEIVLEQQELHRHTMSTKQWVRRKRILPYSYLDDKYGMFFNHQEDNADRFLQGEDHRALLKLWDTMEARGGEGVVYLDAPPEGAHPPEQEPDE